MKQLSFKISKRRNTFRNEVSGAFSSEFVALQLFVAACMLLGGGRGALNIQFFVIFVLGCIVVFNQIRNGKISNVKSITAEVKIVVSILILTLIVQITPLPPGIWQSLPGHELRVEVANSLNLTNYWLPITTSWPSTVYSLIIAILMLGFLSAVLELRRIEVIITLFNISIAILIGALIGIIQYSSNGQSFRFYEIAHHGSLIGFFANKNHMGLAIACMAPIGFILLAETGFSRSVEMAAVIMSSILLLFLAIATNSRAGMLLTIAAILTVGYIQYPKHRLKILVGLLIFCVAFVVLIFTIPSLGNVIERFGQAKEDGRIDIIRQGAPLIWQYVWVGSGLGTFEIVYPVNEKLSWVSPYYVNHLHNDWFQIILEGGLGGVLIVALCVLALFKTAGKFKFFLQLYQNNRNDGLRRLGASCISSTIILWLFAAHSLGDYPLRRVSTLLIFVLAIGIAERCKKLYKTSD